TRSARAGGFPHLPAPRGLRPRWPESELPVEPPAKHAIAQDLHRDGGAGSTLARGAILVEPGGDEPAEDRQADGARAEHRVVEPTDVESRAEARLRLAPQPNDLELADLV